MAGLQELFGLNLLLNPHMSSLTPKSFKDVFNMGVYVISGVVKDSTGQYNLTFIISGVISMMATSVFTMYIFWEQFQKIKDHSTRAKLQVILETEVA